MKKYILLLLICGLMPLSVFAENSQAVADFRKVNEAYTKATSLSMDISYKLFSNYSTAAAYESSTGKYIKQNNNYYSELLGIVTMQNAKHKVTINEAQKSLILSNPQQANQSPSPVMLDSMLKFCSKVESTDLGEGKKLYKLHFTTKSGFEYERIDLEIGSLWMLNRIVLYYRNAVVLNDADKSLQKEKPRLEIVYSAVNLHPTISSDQFSEKKYIVQSGKTFKAATAYASYRFLNLKP